ncbi:adenosine deaminase [Brachybacterium kimchii]|uniref:adenosine deaminase n=1 Tax=Brachybacterium kimchii TaxID=2942909 RepID=A0ABY4N135_9MICO|nr:adenosine deaminase [Brachybacterium kimchii]UQN28259.1 adenosine deaminase [Brachybacterium kimchii]
MTASDASDLDLRALPKGVLHDHLDGGVRPQTVLDLSRELGIEPPAPTAEGIADWFADAADSGSLPRYLETFARVLELMQTPDSLRRVAREFVEDMAADGVVYAETRWAPEQHLESGLSMEEAVDAVQAGLDEGTAQVEAAGDRILVGQILCQMRQNAPREEIVDLAIARQGRGVVGIDLAGPEDGFPASRFRPQLERARAAGVHVTIHAGEAAGVDSIADALDCGAERLGHGVRLIDDIDAGVVGPTARRVREDGVVLEVCPSSNLQTGAFADMPSHPVDALRRAGMRVAVSSDNRLMSRTWTSRELGRIVDTFSWGLDELEQAALIGLDNGFAPGEQRRALREEVVVSAYQAARIAAESRADGDSGQAL